MEVVVNGIGSYTLWDDCAFCFVQGKSGKGGGCTHKSVGCNVFFYNKLLCLNAKIVVMSLDL